MCVTVHVCCLTSGTCVWLCMYVVWPWVHVCDCACMLSDLGYMCVTVHVCCLTLGTCVWLCMYVVWPWGDWCDCACMLFDLGFMVGMVRVCWVHLTLGSWLGWYVYVVWPWVHVCDCSCMLLGLGLCAWMCRYVALMTLDWYYSRYSYALQTLFMSLIIIFLNIYDRHRVSHISSMWHKWDPSPWCTMQDLISESWQYLLYTERYWMYKWGHAKKVVLSITPISSLYLIYQKGLIIFCTKQILLSVIWKRSHCLCYQKASLLVIPKGLLSQTERPYCLSY